MEREGYQEDWFATIVDMKTVSESVKMEENGAAIYDIVEVQKEHEVGEAEGMKEEEREEEENVNQEDMAAAEENHTTGHATGGHVQPPPAAHVNGCPTRSAGAAGSAWDSGSERLGFQMDGRDQQQQQPPPPPPQQQQQRAARVGSPTQAGGGVMMPPHAAFGAAPPGMPPGAANVMHGMPLGFNPLASPGASSPMKPADMPPGAMFRPDTGAPAPGMQHHRVGSGAGGAVVGGSGGEVVKKKRGRPRKYGPDGSIGLGLKPAASTEAGGQSGGGGSNSNPDGKRRGRPPGSGKKKQLDALGSSGTSFTPHILTVKPNEDVASKIMAFSQQGPRTTCIISANGALGTATLRQPATSGGIVTYEGHFDILSLSGSFLLAEDGDTRSRTGGLSIALAGSDGRIVGGCVAGMLMAATPVQVVVGSFIAEGKKPKEEQPKREPISVASHTAGFGAATTASPPSDGTSSEHSDDPGSPLGPNGSTFTNTGHPMHSSYAPVGWTLSGSQGRYDPDVKMMND